MTADSSLSVSSPIDTVSAAQRGHPAPASPDLPSGTIAMLAAEQLDGPLIRSLTKEFERRGAVHSVQLREVPVRPTPPAALGAHGTNGPDLSAPNPLRAPDNPHEEPTNLRAVRWAVTLNDSDDDYGSQLLNSLLEDAALSLGELNGGPEQVTATALPAPQRNELFALGRLMLVMDVDSTLIDEEVIELLARHAGREEEVAAVTERAMRGELDFAESLHARVATLQGLPATVIDSTVGTVTPTQGAEELVGGFRRRGWPVYAVSGGFLQVLGPLAQHLGLTGYHANDLTVSEGRLSGEVAGDVVDRATKRQRLESWAAEHCLGPAQVIAVGDGANDLDMVTGAGVGVAFCPKPALAEQADLVIRHRSLELVGLALGLD